MSCTIFKGKTAILDSLVATAGITSQEVTESNSLISLYYEMPEDSLRSYKDKRAGTGHLINLIDSPVCCNLSNDVQPALCIMDGALVVVDSFEGVTLWTKTSIREALNVKIQPVFTLNKIDRFFLEQNVDGEKAYQTLSSLIDSVNATMSSHKDAQVYPTKGTVVFSSGLHGWAVAISNFAKMYSSKFKVEESKMIDRLWGENFFDLATKKWTKKNTGTATCKRGFVQFCYEPIREIMNACMNSKHKLWPMLEKIHVTVSSPAKELVGIELVKYVIQAWLPACSALSEMMVYHIPSPEKAQRHCVGNFGVDLDNIYHTSVRNCDAEGPLVLYVSKMTLALGKGRYFALGRVFSGKVTSGMNVQFLSPSYGIGERKDLYIKCIKSSLIWIGDKRELVEGASCSSIPGHRDLFDKATYTTVNCMEHKQGLENHIVTGNIVYVFTSDQLIKNSTLTSVKVMPMRAPAVAVRVDCKAYPDLPKFLEALKKLANTPVKTRLNDIPLSELEGCGRYPPVSFYPLQPFSAI